MFNPKVSRPTFFWCKSYHGVDMKNPELFGHQSLVSNKIEMAIWGNNAKKPRKNSFPNSSVSHEQSDERHSMP
jgi:hypothetical protein